MRLGMPFVGDGGAKYVWKGGAGEGLVKVGR